jgi:serine/threonine-protein kinase HipA
LISDTDDHLRNRGFLRRTANGWSLSPAFDINPNPDGPFDFATLVDQESDGARIQTLMDSAGSFRLTRAEAKSILRDVIDAADPWHEQARKLGIEKGEIERLRPAFEHTERESALALI